LHSALMLGRRKRWIEWIPYRRCSRGTHCTHESGNRHHQRCDTHPSHRSPPPSPVEWARVSPPANGRVNRPNGLFAPSPTRTRGGRSEPGTNRVHSRAPTRAFHPPRPT
jgi:hypothetical protein